MTRPKILLTRRWADEVLRHLAIRYDVTVSDDDRPLTGTELAEAMRHFDAICPTVSDRLGADIVGTAGARVRLLANYGVGYEHIDLEAARRAGITVTNTPDVLTRATAELAILLMLMTSRRAGEGERELRAGRWAGWRPTHLMGQSLDGKLLGLVGFGRIARATAVMAAQAFRMRIAYHGRRPAGPVPELAEDATWYESLDALLADADVVSLHCPGGPETFHLINERRLGLMKPTALLINTARGTVVDEAALARALGEGRIAGAGLDVYEREPKVSEALLGCENAVLLPHLGSATVETRVAMGMRVAANLDRFFDGLPPPDRIA